MRNMIISNLTKIRNCSSLLIPVKFPHYFSRSLYDVRHNPKNRLFYVQIEEKQATLNYKIEGIIMNLLSIKIPKTHKGQGIAKLLTKTAFTYAINNNYYLYLTCSYTQKYYLAHKNKQLMAKVVGPTEIKNSNFTNDKKKFDAILDQEDSTTEKK
uniref:Protein NATD1 n=1 Tax=Trichogramma kaykai TaxID=54128 RepID=A0ABD2W9U4_9HYME